jgi:ABC-type glutathione transport system ATPase component
VLVRVRVRACRDPQKTIRAALVKNIRLGQGPLVFHIAGPSGVGKSLTARAVARALMESTGDDTPQDEWCGVRYARWVQPRRPCRHRTAADDDGDGLAAGTQCD